MGEADWSDRMSAIWEWAERMMNGVPRGGVIRLVDLSERSAARGRPAISIVLGQWPGRRVGDVVCSDRLGPEALRRVVAAGTRSGLSAPEWRVHGIGTVPRAPEWVARWLVGLAEASGTGEIAVDTAEMGEREEGRLAAHLRRLAPRAEVAVENAIAEGAETR